MKTFREELIRIVKLVDKMVDEPDQEKRSLTRFYIRDEAAGLIGRAENVVHRTVTARRDIDLVERYFKGGVK